MSFDIHSLKKFRKACSPLHFQPLKEQLSGLRLLMIESLSVIMSVMPLLDFQKQGLPTCTDSKRVGIWLEKLLN